MIAAAGWLTEVGYSVAAVVEIPGVLAYGATQQQAIAQVQALARRVVAVRFEYDEPGRGDLGLTFAAARTRPTPR